jgi:hypothetical protein
VSKHEGKIGVSLKHAINHGGWAGRSWVSIVKGKQLVRIVKDGITNLKVLIRGFLPISRVFFLLELNYFEVFIVSLGNILLLFDIIDKRLLVYVTHAFNIQE